jgi:uncharacterized protein (TIGR03663 family)
MNSAASAGWASRIQLSDPAQKCSANKWSFLPWAGLVSISILIRFLDLGRRSMSYDESIHAFYSWLLSTTGYYRHDPTFHGPLLYHLNALVFRLFSDSDASARLLPALAGTGVVLMIGAWGRYLGFARAWTGALLATLSPTLLFYSRYLRNDIYIALLTLVWGYCALRYLEERRAAWLYLMSLSMALSFSCKEVSFIHGAVLGSFFVGLFLWQHWLRRPGTVMMADMVVVMGFLALPFASPLGQLLIGWNPLLYNTREGQERSLIVAGVFFLLSGFLAMGYCRLRQGWLAFQTEEVPALKWHWIGLTALFWGTQFTFYTTFFSNIRSGLASGISGSLGYWLAQHGVERGGQPWFYYLMLAGIYEYFPMLLVTVAGIGLCIHGFRDRFLQDRVGPMLLTPDFFAAREDPFALVVTRQHCVSCHPEPQAKDLFDRRDPSVRCAPLRMTVKVMMRAFWLQLRRVLLLRVLCIEIACMELSMRRIAILLCAWWMLGNLAIYSWAGEKMPWLMVHISIPLCILAGLSAGRLAAGIDWRAAVTQKQLWAIGIVPAALYVLAQWPGAAPAADRGIAAAQRNMAWISVLLAVLILLWLICRQLPRMPGKSRMRLTILGIALLAGAFYVRASFLLAFRNSELPIETMVYAHGTPDIQPAMADIQLISHKASHSSESLVAYDPKIAWPLVWYLRNIPALPLQTTPELAAAGTPIIIIGEDKLEVLRPRLSRNYADRAYRLLWWPAMNYQQLTWMDVFHWLSSKEHLGQLWRFMAYRKFQDLDVNQWPYREDFHMFVRRDLLPPDRLGQGSLQLSRSPNP